MAEMGDSCEEFEFEEFDEFESGPKVGVAATGKGAKQSRQRVVWESVATGSSAAEADKWK